jgi:hypothetical protein
VLQQHENFQRTKKRHQHEYQGKPRRHNGFRANAGGYLLPSIND